MVEKTTGGARCARRGVRAHQDPPAALAQFVEPEHEFGTLDGRRGLAALKLDICHALDGADPELVRSFRRHSSAHAYGTYNFNWGYYLESLRLLGETGIGKPFQAVQRPRRTVHLDCRWRWLCRSVGRRCERAAPEFGITNPASLFSPGS